jgi:Gly-Xaa carboxypeptidase
VEVISEVVERYGLKVQAYPGDDEYHGTYPGIIEKRDDQFEVNYNGSLTITAAGKGEAAPVSPSTGPVWDIFSGTIRHTFAVKGKTVVPVGYIMTGNTDTAYYLSKCCILQVNRDFTNDVCRSLSTCVPVDAECDWVAGK